MFRSENVWMVFKAAKLTVVDVDNVEHRMAECQLVIDPLPFELANELGESVAIHLYSEAGAIRPELTNITLDPRVPAQIMHARGAEGVAGTKMRIVEILSLTCARQLDDKTGREWIKATVRVRFDFAPKVHREWIAMYFGMGFLASFEAEQEDMLPAPPKSRRSIARDLVDGLRQGLGADGSGSVTFTGPDGSGVRITQDSVENIDAPDRQ